MKEDVNLILAIVVTTLYGITGCSNDDNGTLSSEKKYITQVLITGATLSSASSVNFNPNGELFAVDAGAKKILKMNPETGQILETLTEGVDGPADIDFAADGTMYWMNTFLRQAYKRTPDGKVSKIADLDTYVDGVSVNAEGRVFTASFEEGKDALWEIDPYGEQPPRLVVALGGLDAYDFGPDGYLYAPSFLGGKGVVYKIDVNTGAYEIITEGFCQPISLKFNSVGELYVLDYLCPKMVKVDINTGEKTLIAEVDPGPDNFDFSPTDELFITFLGDTYIGKLLSDGTVKKITTPGLAVPGSISIRSDTLFVSTPFAIRSYDANTGIFKKAFYTDTGMIPPYTLYDDGKYFVLSCHLFNNVQVWDPDTNTAIATYTNVQQPLNAIRFRGDVIIAELGTGSVVKVEDRTPLIEGLSVPAGLAAKGNDLYIGDRETGMIWKAVEFGERLNPARVVVKGLIDPEGMTFDNDGKLLVMEVGTKRLVSVDLESGKFSVVVEGLDIGLDAPGGIPSTGFAMSSIAVSKSGDFYVTGDKGNVVYKIVKN